MTERKTSILGRCPFGGRAPVAPAPDAPACPGRRSLLVGLGLAGGALGLAPTLGVAATAEAQRQAEPDQDGTLDRHEFYGPHQAGIVTPQPAAALIASFDVLAGSRDDLVTLMKRLTVRVAALMAGELPAPADRKLPPSDSGILGPKGMTDGLTVTVACGASLFDDRFGLTS